MDQIVFVILVRTIQERASARLLIDSLRSFAGPYSHSPIWVFEADSEQAPCGELVQMDTQVITLEVPDPLQHYPFGSKVSACAQAETIAAAEVQSLAWLNPECLIVKPPLMFELGDTFDVALRPVHIRNIGIPISEPLDAFWERIYAAAGVEDVQMTVESFVDSQHIRAYFNSHLLAVNPSKGLFRRWLELFELLVTDQDFQAGPCQDELHRIFLHQAVLSALITTTLDPQRIRILPPGYSYPYNLHHQVPSERRARSLNDLICVVYEQRTLDPDRVDDIKIAEPLRSWLLDHIDPS